MVVCSTPRLENIQYFSLVRSILGGFLPEKIHPLAVHDCKMEVHFRQLQHQQSKQAFTNTIDCTLLTFIV